MKSDLAGDLDRLSRKVRKEAKAAYDDHAYGKSDALSLCADALDKLLRELERFHD